MKNIKTHQNGFTMVLSLILALVMGLTVLSIAKLMDFNSRQSAHFNSTDSAYRLAEIGMNAAISQLAKNSDPALATNASPVAVTNPVGTYQNTVSTRSVPFDPIHYVVSEGKTRKGVKSYSTKLHSYVRVSNVGDYFAAIKSDLVLSAGINLASGRVYAPRLEFLTSGSLLTQVLSAEYVESVLPTINTQGDLDPSNDVWTDPGNLAKIRVMSPAATVATNVPRKLSSPLLFPEVFSTDILDWKNKANTHTKVCDFTGEIYPPGYFGYVSNLSGDNYPYGVAGAPNHTTNNNDHIYYCEGDMTIRGKIHGQILFVSTGNIYITGDLMKTTDAFLPGTGQSGASLAHQAILITQKSVFISPNAWINGTQITSVPGSVQTQKIQALIMAPNAALTPLAYGDPAIHSMLALQYTGTLILNDMSSAAPNNFPTVFQAGRTYAYDVSFKNYPPPYLPAIAQIYYIMEQNMGTGNLY